MHTAPWIKISVSIGDFCVISLISDIESSRDKIALLAPNFLRVFKANELETFSSCRNGDWSQPHDFVRGMDR